MLLALAKAPFASNNGYYIDASFRYSGQITIVDMIGEDGVEQSASACM